MMLYRKFILLIVPWVGLALLMNLTRFVMTDIHSYVYMNWNLLLAFLSLLFIFLFERAQKMYSKIIYFFAWLFFLPNAPYIVTDLIHLRDVGPEWMLWFDGMMIFNYAVVGVFITAYVLIHMKKLLFTDSKKQRIFLVIVSILSSFGIYLGRYVRFNSWDIILNPLDIATKVSYIITTEYFNPQFILTIIFFTLFMLVSEYSMRKFFINQK